MAITNLVKLAMETGMTYEPKRGLMYGTYNNFSVAVRPLPSERKIVINVSAKENEGFSVQPFEQFSNELVAQCKAVQGTERQANRMAITLGFKNSGKTNMENVRIVLDSVTGYLNANRYIDCCEICSTEYGVHKYDVNMAVRHICEDCYGNLINGLEMNKQAIKEKKGNIVTGIVGALLGSLIGVVVWVLIAQLGYIAAIGGIVLAVCTLKGYEMLGGKINVTGIIICCVIMVGMIFFANMLSMGLMLFNELKSSYDTTFFECYKLIPELLASEPELMGAFIYDMVVGYAISAVAVVPTVISMFRNKNGIYKAGRIDESVAM